MSNVSQQIHARDESADKSKVDKRDEERRVAGAEVGEQRAQRPHRGQYRGDEEDQDVGRRQLVGVDVAVDEVGQHAEDGDGDDELEDAEGNEEEAGECHLGGLWAVVRVVRGGVVAS